MWKIQTCKQEIINPEKTISPPPMQKIGTTLNELCRLIADLDKDKALTGETRKKLADADKKLHYLVDVYDEYISGGSLFFAIGQYVSESRRAKEAESVNKQKFIDRIDKVIIEGMEGGNIDIDSLTDALCMSRSTLYRRVKSLTGISANEYIRRKRMEIAKELLIDGGIPVSEIAYKVGCSSMSYFRQTFKDIYGVIPSEYLRNLKSS